MADPNHDKVGEALMPLYTFQSADGEAREIAFSMRDAPATGEQIDIDGKVFTRVPDLPQLSGVERKTWGYPRLSNSLPTTTNGCKMVRQKKANGTYSRPKPLIESQRHEREVMARNDLVRDEE